MTQLNMNLACPVILASASPRRKELLAGMGIDFTVVPADAVLSAGCVVIDGAVGTESVTTSEMTSPRSFVMTQRYCRPW